METQPSMTAFFKRSLSLFALSLAGSLLLFSCGKTEEPRQPDTAAYGNIIPKPMHAQAAAGAFVFGEKTNVAYPQESQADLAPISAYLGAQLDKDAGDSLYSSGGAGQIIFLKLAAAGMEGVPDSYELKVNSDSVIISAATGSGIFYGVQTLRQLLTKVDGKWLIPAGNVHDKPEFAWRGSMLDVARHFYSVEDVKRYFDFLAYYKMNVAHLHLSDDQGWRIEIKSWPDLTTIGGKTQVDGGGGGFYTQEQYKDLVKYAQERFITVIPEIDLPGHTNAALASYAILNCNGKATQLYEGNEVGFSSLCPGKEISTKFVTDVVKELAEMTPGPYIHIGGDEAHSTKKNDYINFINTYKKIVADAGKVMIGWEEIAQAEINGNDIAQHWASPEHPVAAAAKGAKVIMSPAKKVYLDMKYDSTTKLGQQWAAFIEIDDSYNWDPLTIVPGLKKESILGVEAPIWTEKIRNMEELEYMLFPRLPGAAEIGWTPSSSRNWEEYKVRLGAHGKKMTAMGINFYKSARVPWQ